MPAELLQLLLGLISGTTITGVTLFRWGWQFQKLTAQFESRIELLGKELKEQNEKTLSKIMLIEKDFKHSDEITSLQTKNDIENIKGKLAVTQSRITDIERYLIKTNGFKARNRQEEEE